MTIREVMKQIRQKGMAFAETNLLDYHIYLVASLRTGLPGNISCFPMGSKIWKDAVECLQVMEHLVISLCMHRLRIVGLPHISGYGGLSIKDLEAFSLAFRLRWEWFRWDEEDWPWKGAATSCDQSDMDLFAACTTLCWEWWDCEVLV
jgi:hypothetical protein